MMTGILIAALALLAILAGGLKLNKDYIPGPLDANMVLQAAVTKTASFDSAGFNLGAGFAPGGVGSPMAAVVDVTACVRNDGDETYTFTLQECDTVDGSYTACGAAVAVDVSGTDATLGAISVPGFVSKPYVRLSLVIAGTTPSITYSAHLVPIGRPN